jgi:hypothetical protein
MSKRFGRPAPFQPSTGAPVAIRPINLQREASGIEGVYALVASQDAMRLESYELERRRAQSDGLLYWCITVAFWGLIVAGLLAWVR